VDEAIADELVDRGESEGGDGTGGVARADDAEERVE
jgi:hypothetical protein